MNLDAVDAILTEFTKPDEPGAAVAILRDGEVIHHATYGLATLEWGLPITPDTVFRLGSLTKSFTAAAFMLLQEEGRLRLDDPITHYLPDFPTNGVEITIHHLLSNTSGIWNHTSHSDVLKRSRQDLTPREIAAEFWDHPFEFKPGTRFEYSNSGWILLGMIIEQVSGMPYADFMRTHLFEPLGMAQTRYLDAAPIIPKRASGYEKDENGFRNAGLISMTYPYAGGALGSTLDDMVRWEHALTGNELISAESFAQMNRSALLEDGSEAGYGYGWFTAQYRGMPLSHHGGGIHGFCNTILRYHDPRLTIILLTNRADHTPHLLTMKITRAVLGLPEMQHTPCDLSDVPPERYTGRYEVRSENRIIEITYENGEYYCKGNAVTVIKPINERQFYRVDNPENTLDFSDEVDGCFTRVAFNIVMFAPLIGWRVTESAC